MSLLEELKKAEQEYINAWAQPIDMSFGYLAGKIKWDLNLEEAGDRVERARIAYQEAIG